MDFKERMKRNPQPVHLDIIDPAINTNINTETNIDNNINIIQQRPKYTEVHKATMVYIESELSNELDGYSKGKKGMKSQIINEALRQYFKKIKKKENLKWDDRLK